MGVGDENDRQQYSTPATGDGGSNGAFRDAEQVLQVQGATGPAGAGRSALAAGCVPASAGHAASDAPPLMREIRWLGLRAHSAIAGAVYGATALAQRSWAFSFAAKGSSALGHQYGRFVSAAEAFLADAHLVPVPVRARHEGRVLGVRWTVSYTHLTLPTTPYV